MSFIKTHDAIKTYILPKKSVKKLDIFLFIIRNQPVTTIEVAEHFKISTKNLALCLQELQTDFSEIKESQLIIYKRNTNISIESPDLGLQYYLLFNRYCTDSTDYILLRASLHKDNTSIPLISEATSYSPSHIYTRMRNLNQLLELYGLSISFSSSAERVIQGTEFQLHYFFLDFYWTIFLNLPLINKRNSFFYPSVVKKIIRPEILQQLDKTSQEKLNFLIKITLYRFSYSSIEDINIDYRNYPYLPYFLNDGIDITQADTPLCKEQRFIINIVARTTIANLDTIESVTELFYCLEKSEVSEYYYVTELFTQFCISFSITMDNANQLLYTFWLFKLLMYTQLFVSNQPTTSLHAFSQSNNPELEAKIQDFIHQYKQQNTQFSRHFQDTEKIFWIVELFAHIYLKFAEASPVLIGINYTRDFNVILEIHSKITQSFNNDKIKFEFANFKHCDLVISDYPFFDLPTSVKKFQILDESLSEKDWQQLFLSINSLIIQKNSGFSREVKKRLNPLD
ncbi:helix-turn-helix domain-containing protein [Enterococcus sp. DIV1444a]|uniref:helix-turn-helix domain-containing protein n=1 Tax=Enterococcus sp. DIV1444a TaxID=2774679 RepID=UPI003F2288F1